jgi:hypothetical protein
MQYDAMKSLGKGLALLLWGAFAAAVSAALGQIPAVDAGATPTIDTSGIQPVLTTILTGIILFAYGAFNNWRKKSPKAPSWLRDLNVVPIIKILFPVLLVCLLAAGCATNRASFSEKLYDGDTGLPTSETTFSTTVMATAGSRVSEGAGSMSYSGKDWKLDVGGSAQGLKAAGDPAQLLQTLTLLAPVLLPLLQPPAPAEPTVPVESP